MIRHHALSSHYIPLMILFGLLSTLLAATERTSILFRRIALSPHQ